MSLLEVEMGTKIVFCNPDAGYQGHQDNAAKHLVVGQEYTLDGREIGGCHTDIWIKEVDGIAFNSVMFEVVEDTP